MNAAGPLRHRVTLQRVSFTTGPFGQKVSTWTDVGTYWARVRPASGQERLVGQQIQAETTHAVELRWVGAITPADRLLFEGRVLNIKQVLDVAEMGTDYKLMCLEVVDGQ